MATHIHPLLRAREDAQETAGLFLPLKSVAIVNYRSLELQGLKFRIIPLLTYKFNGTNFTPAMTTGTP